MAHRAARAPCGRNARCLIMQLHLRQSRQPAPSLPSPTETAANNYLLSLRAVWIIFHSVECPVCALALTGGCPALSLSALQKPAPQRDVYPPGPTVKS